MSNGNAKKYFDMYDETSNKTNLPNNGLVDESVRRAINKVKKNVMQGASSTGSTNNQFYKPPIPEKTLSNKEESLDDVIKKIKKIPSTPSPRSSRASSGSQMPSYISPKTNKASPFRYLLEEALNTLEKELIPNPSAPSYLLATEFIINTLGSPTNWSEEIRNKVVTVFASLGVEKGISFLTNYLKKQFNMNVK